MIYIRQNGTVGRRTLAGEEGGMFTLSHLPTFLGDERKYSNGGSAEH